MAQQQSAGEFYKWFNDHKAHIENVATTISSDQDRALCLAQLSELETQCRNSRHILPVHDQKLYSSALESLSNLITNGTSATASKPRFTLLSGRRGKQKVAAGSPAAQVSPVPAADPVPVATEGSPSSNRDTDNRSSAAYEISDQLNSWIDHVPPHTPVVHLSRLKSCVVYLSEVSFQSIKIDDVEGCVIVIRSVLGPVYVSGSRSSTIVTACHQFRIHQSKTTDIFISCRSLRPVIEKSSQLGFGQLPGLFISDGNPAYPWTAIDDFSWLRKSKSINWEPIENNRQWSILERTTDVSKDSIDNVREQLLAHA